MVEKVNSYGIHEGKPKTYPPMFGPVIILLFGLPNPMVTELEK